MTTKALIAGELIVAVDFDGTISTDPNMATLENLQLHPHCKRVLERMCDQGIRLILWTCRTGKAMEDAMTFLNDNGMLHLFEQVNDHISEIHDKYPLASRKIAADVYIDDKNVGAVIDWIKIEIDLFGESEVQ